MVARSGVLSFSSSSTLDGAKGNFLRSRSASPASLFTSERSLARECSTSPSDFARSMLAGSVDLVKSTFGKLRDALLAFRDGGAQPLDLTARLLQRERSLIALFACIRWERRNRIEDAKFLTQFLQSRNIGFVACDSTQRHQ